MKWTRVYLFGIPVFSICRHVEKEGAPAEEAKERDGEPDWGELAESMPEGKSVLLSGRKVTTTEGER